MNRTVLPTAQSASAAGYFAHWLCEQMAENNVNAVKLADYCGLERKTIYDYCAGKRYPKLDVLAKILFYFDCKKIEIPMEVDNDDLSGT